MPKLIFKIKFTERINIKVGFIRKMMMKANKAEKSV